MPEKTEFDEAIVRFLTLSASYFAQEILSLPIGVREDRRHAHHIAARWPRRRERRGLVGNPRQFPNASCLP